MINDNSHGYLPAPDDFSRLDDKYQPFLAHILSVDYERKVCTIQDDRNQMVFSEVRILPASYSSVTATDVNMPEEGAACLALKIAYNNGFAEVAIVSYLVDNTVNGIDAIAHRTIEGIPGWRERTRGTYRKTYPGQHTTVLTGGYSQKTDEGWDHLASDFSRDKLDVNSRTHTETTSRQVRYTDAGLEFSGPVNRPGAIGIHPSILPDGSKQYIVHLFDTILSHRYLEGVGTSDIIAFSEKTEKIQEFALDYAVPQEILQDKLLDTILGTTRPPAERTKVNLSADGKIYVDDETFLVSQDSDHPYSRDTKAVGPITGEGTTPRRRGWIIEKTEGTLVGHNQFDQTTYGLVLKPVVFPYTRLGRFGADVESSYIPVQNDPFKVEAQVAASTFSFKFPSEHNTTRFDITKEGFSTFEIGSTLPYEKNPFNLGTPYEHPHGAGRSLEGNLTGSLKLVVGKNRDEEESIDLTALGQTVMRLGSDDTSLPNDRHETLYQERGQSDKVVSRSLQYWSKSNLSPGDAIDLENKKGAENISLRAALDGGAVIRFGARHPNSKRRHLVNGYKDAKGQHPYSISDPSRKDSKTAGRPTYGSGDSTYAFHDLTQAGKPKLNMFPYNWSGMPVANMDQQGLSIDFHTVRDVLLRIGADEVNNQSLILDLAGGIVAWIGKDSTQGRSITATLDGGVEMVIGHNNQKKGLRLEINGDVDWTVKGNVHWNITGDFILEDAAFRHDSKTDNITTAQKFIRKGLARITDESTDICHNEGLYFSDENT